MKQPFIVCYAILLLCCFCGRQSLFAQNVGIGTNTPHAKAALEVRSTDKGVLFPTLTTVQRNLITNPPNGLHIFNTDERCLNYYDSVNQVWNCYCSDCQTTIINITANACKLDFYNSYAKNNPSKKYLINIAAGVTISGCVAGDTALIFNTMLSNAEISINNYGTIAGAGGKGGNAAISKGCYVFAAFAVPGQDGGSAISTRPAVLLSINNYGIIAGGGGGGGGSSGSSSNSGDYGGGGGGGAGSIAGPGGNAGGVFVSSPIVGCIGAISYQSQPGAAGQSTAAGAGGAGANGAAAGGNGGVRAQPGFSGAGYFVAPGGAAGKAIVGGSGNSITNISGGQYFGTIN